MLLSYPVRKSKVQHYRSFKACNGFCFLACVRTSATDAKVGKATTTSLCCWPRRIRAYTVVFPKLKMLELLLLVLDVVLAAANVPPANVPPNKPPPVALVADDPLDSAAPFWEFVEFSSTLVLLF